MAVSCDGLNKQHPSLTIIRYPLGGKHCYPLLKPDYVVNALVKNRLLFNSFLPDIFPVDYACSGRGKWALDITSLGYKGLKEATTSCV